MTLFTSTIHKIALFTLNCWLPCNCNVLPNSILHLLTSSDSSSISYWWMDTVLLKKDVFRCKILCSVPKHICFKNTSVPHRFTLKSFCATTWICFQNDRQYIRANYLLFCIKIILQNVAGIYSQIVMPDLSWLMPGVNINNICAFIAHRINKHTKYEWIGY